jgi:predicted O-methyltransferase YrrM
VITLVEGDATALISAQTGPFDFVFLDAEKGEYAEYLRLAVPLVRSGGLIVGDDTISLRDQMPDYLDLAFSHPELESVDVPIDDGIVLSYRK